MNMNMNVNNNGRQMIGSWLLLLVLTVSVASQVGPMDTEFPQATLDAHNSFRRMTASGLTANQPKASMMIELSWDPALENIGRAHMNERCTVRNTAGITSEYMKQPNKAMADYNEGIHIGQLKHYSTDPTATPQSVMEEAVEKWYSGHEDYSFSGNKCQTRGSMCSSYRQLVWSTTRFVGCAYRRCESLRIRGQEKRETNATYVQCYYLRSAWGGRPYRKSDRACVDCPSDRSICSNSLCTNDAKIGCDVTKYIGMVSQAQDDMKMITAEGDKVSACLARTKTNFLPSDVACSGMAKIPAGCVECLPLVAAWRKLIDGARAMSREMSAERDLCSVPVSPSVIDECVEGMNLERASGVEPSLLVYSADYSCCKDECASDETCGCFLFSELDNSCELFTKSDSCVVGMMGFEREERMTGYGGICNRVSVNEMPPTRTKNLKGQPNDFVVVG